MYAQIVDVIIPDSAVPGKQVNVDAIVKRVGGPSRIACSIFMDNIPLDVQPDEINILPYDTGMFMAAFIMPGSQVSVWIVSSYYDDWLDNWVGDDEKTYAVSVSGGGGLHDNPQFRNLAVNLSSG